ncbi:MAG: hypothetical protein ACFB0C_19570 [Leptolyngbyaceae cyanobacterium]
MTLAIVGLSANAFQAELGMELAVSPTAIILGETGTPKAESGLIPWEGYAGGDVTLEFDISAEALVTTGNIKLDVAFRKVTSRVAPFSTAEYATAKSITIARGATPANLQDPKPTLTFTASEIDGLVAGNRGQLLILRDNTVSSNATGIGYLHNILIKEV